MKKKKSKLIWIILILLIMLAVIIYLYFQDSALASTDATTSTDTTITETTVGTQTITKTLSSSGEISSGSTQTLELNTYRYFKEIYVSENEAVEEGEYILKYTNGTYLVAPYNLVITGINVPEEGNKCTSNHGITVQSTVSMVMTLNIDESEVGSLEVGQEVEIIASAFEDTTYKGTITKINEIGNYASNGSSFTGTVEFENDGRLKIGMSASCTVILEKVENVIAVPIEAVQTSDNQKYVIVVDGNGSTKNVAVETGLSNDAYVEIKNGLNGGETIQMIKQTSTSTTNSRGGMQVTNNGGRDASSFMQGGQMSMPSSMGGSMPGM